MSELITLDEAIDWGKRGELCDLMTEEDQRQVAEWLRQVRGANAAERWYTDRLRDANRGLREVMTESAKLREENERFVIKLNAEHIARQNVESENAKLREIASEAFSMAFNFYHGAGTSEDLRELKAEYRKLGIEASE